jgi:iron complex outermembrane receptor protein
VNVQTRTNVSNLNQGLNLKYKLDSLGSEWTTDISYTANPATTNQYFQTGNGHLENKLHFFSAQSNLVKKLRGQITAEVGVKTTGVNFNNVTDYYKNSGSGSIKDEARSGSYKYRENINSAFVQVSKNFSGVIVKAGTRMENTNMQGDQLTPVDTSFNIHRTDFFPYVYISKTVMKIAGYDLRAYLVYRRTINRPAYEYLNPSLRFVDPYLYETGNPSLRPQFTQNYEANVSVDERPIVAVGLNNTKDIFTQVVYPLDSNHRISTRTYDNLGSNKETYIRLMGAIPPGGKYFGVVWAQYNHNFYDGAYENKPLAYKKGSWTFFTYHLLKLTPLTNLSLNGFIRLNGQQQFYELSTFGEARASLSQQLFKKKVTLSLSATDIFNTNQNEFTIDQGSTHASGVRKSDTQRFGINLRYNFGIRKKEDSVNPFTIQPG